MNASPIMIEVDPFPSNEALNVLFSDAWNATEPRDFSLILSRSLAHICAIDDGELVGFVNVAWDGADHAFILDTCVHSKLRGRGIATLMIKKAAEVAKERSAKWLHVDFEPHLAGFYSKCGFRPTEAGLINF